MHPRWHSDSGAPTCPKLTEDRSPNSPAEGLFNAPLPDLEQQLAAELEGAAWGVVAFAPEDALWCDWIYRNLNGYPLPASLVDRVTPHGFPRPDCLSIFPDRRDPAYEDHRARALEGGVYLVVVCSPHSARAEMVEEQISTFKKGGGEERIIALVVDGPPDVNLGAQRRLPQCDWLPSWLRWRLEEEGFRTADRNEPRIVDARRGYRSLKQVRDNLLTALVDMGAAEFERLGGCARAVEVLTVVGSTVTNSPAAMTTAVAITPPPTFEQRRGSKFTITVAIVLILVAVIFGIRSFKEIMADDPVSTLEVGPVTGVLAGHSTRLRNLGAEATAQSVPLQPDAVPTPEPAAPVTPPPAPEAVVVETSGPAVPAAPSAPTAPVVVPGPVLTAPAAVPRSNVTQVTPAQALATSRIIPVHAPISAPAPAPEQVSATAPPASPVANSEADAVLLDEVKTLERRGDETMAEKRVEDALDLYHTALLSAQEYAMRKGTNPVARDQVVKLMGKLATLQMQNSSTAEARATYMQARKALLLLKQQGQWSRERAKALDEVESRLLSLPRD